MAEVFGIIGGTGLYTPDIFDGFEKKCVESDYGEAELLRGKLGQADIVFLSRHGVSHSMPPHQINYRANIAALNALGVSKIIAINAVGGIGPGTGPGALIVPDQIIDYSWGRAHTFYDSFVREMKHIDFTHPFNPDLRDQLVDCLKTLGKDFVGDGCYGCTQGPRLETAAEIRKYRQDGCSIVGMTGMPEAALARELDIAYASLCFSVNWAAGIKEAISLAEIKKCVDTSTLEIQGILKAFFSSIV